MSEALHEMNPRGRFSDRASDYKRFRPSYPAAAIDAVVEGLGPAERTRAADVGAGTGISARLVAERGVRVIAIEPNAEMRAAAGAHPDIEWRDGTAERTGLEDESLDLLLCAQAFHWFDAPKALREFARVLRPGGRLALVWNRRDDGDSFTRGYIEAIRSVHGEHPAEMMRFDPKVVPASGLFSEVKTKTFPNEQRLDREGLIGRAMSASYTPKAGEGGETVVRLLNELFEKYRDGEGMVTLKYGTDVHVGERAMGSGQWPSGEAG